jgi:hypothetical protein
MQCTSAKVQQAAREAVPARAPHVGIRDRQARLESDCLARDRGVGNARDDYTLRGRPTWSWLEGTAAGTD